MKTKPPKILQTAVGLSGDVIDGKFGPQAAGLVAHRLQSLNPSTKTDWRVWPEHGGGYNLRDTRGGSSMCIHALGGARNDDRMHVQAARI